MLQYPRNDYDKTNTVLYKTNLYSGTDADLDNSAPVSQVDGYTKSIDLTSDKGVDIDFKFDASGATDNLVLKLHRSSTGAWDGTEILVDNKTVTSDGSQDIYNYVIGTGLSGPGYYRFSMQSSGASDTFDIQVTGRFWRGVIDED